MMNKIKKNQKGFIALISILIISSIVLLITISLSWQSTSELQMSWWTNQSEQAYSLASSGLEEGLQRLRLNWQDYDLDLDIDGNSCIIGVTTSFDRATITSQAIVDKVERGIVAIVDQDLNFISWEEN